MLPPLFWSFFRCHSSLGVHFDVACDHCCAVGHSEHQGLAWQLPSPLD